MTRWDVINAELATFRVSRFLEIGTGFGRGARLVDADLKVGVDPFPRNGIANYDRFYESSSDAYFQGGSPIFDVIFIDGLHHAEQVSRDIEHALGHLSPEGTIIVHDCNPLEELDQIVPRPKGRVHWNGDCWKSIVMLRALSRTLDVFTLDIDEGLGIIHRSECEHEPVIGLNEIALTWDGLVRNRRAWLGLR